MSIIDEFIMDAPVAAPALRRVAAEIPYPDIIHGVSLTALREGADERGFLNELLTTRDAPVEPIVHVYQVAAAPGSLRAWTLHKHHWDRLAFTQGTLRFVLYDARPDSPTRGHVNVFDVGDALRCLLVIPPLVIHGVQNRGDDWARFVNMPTRVYDPASPDKWRLPPDHPDIPYRFG